VNAVAERVAVNVARGDIPSTMMAGEILTKEGWFSEGHQHGGLAYEGYGI
jgi:hypothetical protein